MRWLERYLREGSPRLQHFAEITASLASASREIADDAPELASHLRIEERDLEAGGVN